MKQVFDSHRLSVKYGREARDLFSMTASSPDRIGIPAKRAAAVDTQDAGAKQRLFIAAERLVAERGFAVSSRDITAEAGVNLAAINYYFVSKNGLFLDIFRKRATEMNRERSLLLQATVSRDPGDVRGILRALIEPPTLWVSDARKTALRFLNRARSEGPLEVREIIQKDVRHLRRFADALVRALPGLDRVDILWRLHFALGVLHHNSASDYARLDVLSDGACTPDDREALLRRLTNFVVAGFGV
jgi:AcrR family transcriptional regulator